MNKVILIGRLTKDPELRTISNGNSTVSFSIAVNRTYTNQNGEREADFINCVAWRRQAENLAKYCSKGAQIAVEGRIQTRNYDANDGTKRYVTEVVADNITFLSSKASSTAGSYQSSNYNTQSNNDDANNQFSNDDYETTDLADDPFKDFGQEVVLSDDDLPF